MAGGIPEVSPYIREFLKDNDSDVRKSTIEALAEIGDKESSPTIRKLLNDKDRIVCDVAIDALGRLGDKESIPAIREFLKDMDVRVVAAKTLSRLGDKESIPAIREFLKDKSLSEGGIYTVVGALARLGDKESIPAIRELLKNKEWFMRGGAAIALIELGAKDKVPKEVIDDIKLILGGREDDTQRARAALKELGVQVDQEK